MIKKLKARFVLVNMLILTFVLFATLSAIYIMMANSEIRLSNETMDMIIENHQKVLLEKEQNAKERTHRRQEMIPAGMKMQQGDEIRTDFPLLPEVLTWQPSEGIQLVKLDNIIIPEVTESAPPAYNFPSPYEFGRVYEGEDPWAAWWGANPWAAPQGDGNQWWGGDQQQSGENQNGGQQSGGQQSGGQQSGGQQSGGQQSGGQQSGGQQGDSGQQSGDAQNPWDGGWWGFNPWGGDPWGGQNPWQNGDPWNGQESWPSGDPWNGQNPWPSGDPWNGQNPWPSGDPWNGQNPWPSGDPWNGQNPWEGWQPPAEVPSASPENSPAPPSEEARQPEEQAHPDEHPSPEPSRQEEQTEPAVTEPAVTEADTSGNAVTDSGKTMLPPAAHEPPQKPVEDEPPYLSPKYNGNLVRSHILADINRGGEIKDLSLQYFLRYEDDTIDDEKAFTEQVRDQILKIVNDESTSGTCTIGTIYCRYKMSDNGPGNDRTLVLLDRSIELSTLHRLMISFIIIGCAGLIIVFIFSLFLASWAIKPIEVAWNRQKQFIADASHELKTPLTVIATNADVVLSNPNDTIRDQERWLKYIRSETARMSKLVTELLYIAKSDSNEIRMERSEFDISNTVSGVCLNFEALAFESDRELIADISPKLKYFGDEDRIKQLITILVDNAIKYSIIGSQISVSMFRNNQNRIKICVSNRCEDMTEENISKLFDRFYRVDPSRNSGTGGNGLGLNIAQSIAEAHGGSINVNYNHGIISFVVVL
ncbi:HAMP domain-containing sensor histidine kinase [Ruminococcus sp. HUN007]|uniref:sensor histidine kinase n=1 Tax=Ruminococcus sp. HUN007 TaxID=1514668 RepID=UPI0006785E7F|nr:HAMP domain-containing sensor histidine kinase [Ruminococcus sp. HUN007]